MPPVSSKPGISNLQPYTVSAFQRTDGSSLLWIGGCLDVKGAGTETIQTAYEYCATHAGIKRFDMDQVADPTPIQMSARGEPLMQQQLYNIWSRSRDTGCTVNLLVLQRDCVDAARTRDPNFFIRGYWMRGLRATGRWTFGNDTLVGSNAKSPQLTEDQGSFTVGSIEAFTQEDYVALNQSLTREPFQLAVADKGSCPNGDCGTGYDGGNVVVYIGDNSGVGDAYVSYNAGATWASGPTLTDAGYCVANLNGHVLVADHDATSYLAQPQLMTFNDALSSFTTTVPVIVGSGTFYDKINIPGNAPFMAPDGTALWLMGTGQVFKSTTNGGIWTRIANGVSLYTTAAKTLAFVRGITVGNRVYAIARDADTSSAQTIYAYSDDSGVTWSLASYVVESTPTTVGLFGAGDRVFVENDGDLFEWTKLGVGTTDIAPAGIATVKQVISLGMNGNDILLVDGNNAIWRSVDGLQSAHKESTVLDTGATAFAHVFGAMADYVYIAGGNTLARAKQKGYMF